MGVILTGGGLQWAGGSRRGGYISKSKKEQ